MSGMCNVEWLSPKVFPSLHCFYKYCCTTPPHRPKQPKLKKTTTPQTKKGKKPQEKLLEKSGAIIKKCLMKTLVALSRLLSPYLI